MWITILLIGALLFEMLNLMTVSNEVPRWITYGIISLTVCIILFEFML